MAKLTKKQQAAAVAVAIRLKFTDAEITAIQRAARGVWDSIGYDAITSCAEADGKNPDRFTMSREEVMEIACDAGRLEEELNAAGSDLAKRIQSLGTDLYTLILPAFPEGRYGL